MQLHELCIVFFLPSPDAIMVPKWANKTGQNKDGKKGYGGDKKGGMSRVPTFRALCKEKLAPYPDESGCPFYIDEANDEKEFFILNHLFKSRTQKNCEAFHRRSLLGRVLDVAFFYKKLPKHTPVEEIECLKKTGLQDFRALLGTEDGKQFLQAVEVLDVGKTQKPSKAKLELAVGAYVDFQVEHTSEL